MKIDEQRLYRLNFNLLKIFNALYKHRNTGEVAKRLHVTRPAISKALKQLREELGDPLFIRSGNRFEPTHRADILGRNLNNHLEGIFNDCYPEETFDPKTYDGSLTIAIASIFFEALAPNLLLELSQAMPNAKIALLQSSADICSRIEDSEVSIAINHSPFTTPKIIREVPVIEEELLILMHKNHSLANTHLTDASLRGTRLCSFITPHYHEQLNEFEEKRKNVGTDLIVRSENLSALFKLVQETDFILTLMSLASRPRPTDIVCCSMKGIKSAPKREFSVLLHYLSHNHQDPLYIWLVDYLKKLIIRESDETRRKNGVSRLI